MAESYIISLGGAAIMLMVGIISWASKRWLGNWEDTTKAIIAKLDNIKDQIDELKTENALQTAYIREVESRLGDRIDRVEKRVDNKRERIAKNDYRISEIEKTLNKVILHHERNHPTDKF